MYNISYDFAGMFLALMFIGFHMAFFDGKDSINRMFRIYMLLAAFECGMNVFTGVIIDGRIMVSDFWGLELNQIYLAGALATAFYGFLMVIARVGYNGRILKEIATGIFILGELALFINQFIPYFFSFRGGQYSKTPLFSIIYVISFLFCFFMVLGVFLQRKEASKAETLAPFFFVIVLTLTFGFQMIFPNVLLTGIGKVLAGAAYCLCLEKPEHILLRNAVLELEESNREQDSISKQLAEANKEKLDFLVSMSHELRTPINAILGFNEIMIRESDDSKLLEHARELEHLGGKLLDIVEEIADFSQIETGQLELRECEYEVGEAFNFIHECLSKLRKTRHIEIISEISEKIPQRLYGDKKRIYQALAKLIEKSIGDAESSTLHVKLELDRIEDDKAYMSCYILNRDGRAFLNGTEAAENDVEYIIICSILDSMNCKLSYSMGEDGSNVYKFNLVQEIVDLKPIGKIEQAAEKYKSALQEMESPYTFTMPDAAVLVVDDNSTNILVFAGLIEPFKLNLSKAASGEEALELMRRNEYDLVFMDILMPGMDGVETLHHIREDEDILSKSVPVLAVTANVFLGARDKYLKEGFTDYLTKPISAQRISVALKTFLPDKVSLDWVNLYVNEDTEKAESADTFDGNRYRNFLSMDDEDEEEDENENVSAGYMSVPDYEEEFAETKITFDDIQGLDVKAGLNLCLGNMELYMELLRNFCMNEITEELSGYLEAENWDSYRILIHGTKSAAATIGLAEISQGAKKLEDAARSQDFSYIYQNHSTWLEQYTFITNMMRKLF